MNELIEQAIAQYKPRHIFALYSGGNDSICSSHLAQDYMDAVVLIDTGIAIREAHEHVRRVTEQMGWKLLVYKSNYSYDGIVMKYGFPGPAQHGAMYIQLKERAVDALIRDHKQKRSDKIILITGVRKSESQRRAINVTSPIVVSGATVWVSPMWDWSTEQRDQYIQDNNLPTSPIKPILHISGDCLCGAYADRGEMELLRQFYPKEYHRIKSLQDKVMQKFPWGWEEKPPPWWKEYQNGQRFFPSFEPLCWSCERRFTED